MLKGIVKDREIKVKKYREMLDNKFEVEKKLDNLINEIKDTEQKDVIEIDDEITGLIHKELDKNHVEEVYSNYLQ